MDFALFPPPHFTSLQSSNCIQHIYSKNQHLHAFSCRNKIAQYESSAEELVCKSRDALQNKLESQKLMMQASKNYRFYFWNQVITALNGYMLTHSKFENEWTSRSPIISDNCSFFSSLPSLIICPSTHTDTHSACGNEEGREKQVSGMPEKGGCIYVLQIWRYLCTIQ